MVKIKKDYCSQLNIKETQEAIKYIKDCFERSLAKKLCLTRVSAPLFVTAHSGTNDYLSGSERAIDFWVPSLDEKLEIVQSLAKWKRIALQKYDFSVGKGLYTDMNAIRKDEQLDNIHSIYVDQWDWELIIKQNMRETAILRQIVRKIYQCLLQLEKQVYKKYPVYSPILPPNIYFFTTNELEKKYPTLTPKERENAICKEYKAVFLSEIGWPLKSGKSHDTRAADYDDWNLNGDILLWYDVLEQAFEISSMGIRVDAQSLKAQLEYKNEINQLNTPYCQAVIREEVPYTIGGGIGQSRLCMFYLRKLHIGEIQASIWSEEDKQKLAKHRINIL